MYIYICIASLICIYCIIMCVYLYIWILYGLGPGSSINIHGRMTISFDVDMYLPYPALVYM